MALVVNIFTVPITVAYFYCFQAVKMYGRWTKLLCWRSLVAPTFLGVQMCLKDTGFSYGRCIIIFDDNATVTRCSIMWTETIAVASCLWWNYECWLQKVNLKYWSSQLELFINISNFYSFPSIHPFIPENILHPLTGSSTHNHLLNPWVCAEVGTLDTLTEC